jgi:hypothetical protein
MESSLPTERTGASPVPSIGYYVLSRYADIEQVFSDPASC